MKWFDLFCLMRSCSMVPMAEGKTELYFINEEEVREFTDFS